MEGLEIGDNEREGEDEDEIALTSPRSSRTGPPSTPSPVKALFVLFHLDFFFSILSAAIFSVRKNMLFPLPIGMSR